MESRKVLPALILIIVLVSCAIIWFYPPTGDFRVDNPAWNGYSELSKNTGALALASLSDLPSSGDGTALVLVPYEQFTTIELSEINNYVSSGGTLVLLDDYGYGDQVLGNLGLNARFSGQTLLDPLFNYKNKWFPTITDFSPTTANVNVSSIVFNHATYLNGTTGMMPIAFSSDFSFADANNNATYDAGELNGPLAVAAYAKLGQGFVVVVSDPSLAINGMIYQGSNREFINKIVYIGGGVSQVYIDQSHLPATALDEAKGALAVVYGVVAYPLGTLALIVVVMAYSFNRFYKRGKLEGS
jgi:hypothetical protein